MLPEQIADPLLYAAGAALLVVGVRWWRPALPKGWAAGYALLVFALFAVPLATSLVQVPVDLAYQWQPWRGTLEEPVRPQNPLLADVPLQMLPFRTLVRERLLALEAPLWTHELGTGQPLLGNAQSAPFAPLHLMALPVPPLRALTVAAAWQVLVGLLLTHALVLALADRRRGHAEVGPATVEQSVRWSHQVGAATGAVAFGLSLYSVAWLYHPLSMVAMFLPGLILGIVVLARGEPRALPGLVACAVAMATSGHPETLGHAAVAAGGLGLVLLARGPRVGRLRFVGRAVLASLLAFSLAAPAVLPVLDALPESERLSFLERRGGLGVRPPELSAAAVLPLVQPLAFGSPRDRDWSGPVNLNELCTHYAGLLTLVLALAGAAACGGRILAIVGAGAAALAVAVNVGPAFELFHRLPGMEHAAHGRLRLFWVLAVAVAAGLTVTRLADAGRRLRLVGASVAAALLGVAAFVPPLSFDAPLRALWWGAALAGPAAAVVVLLAPSVHLRRRLLGALPVLLLCDLALLGARYHPLVPSEQQLATPRSIAWLQERLREAPEPFRVVGAGWDLLPNLGAVYGLWDARGNDPMRPARPTWLTAGSLSRGSWRPGATVTLRNPWADHTLSMLGVRYVLTERGVHRGAPWSRAFDDSGVRVFELPTALPLFHVPHRARRIDRPGGARAVASKIEDYSALAVYTEAGATNDSPRIGFERPVAQSGKVWIREVRPNGFELVTNSRRGALVASSVSDAPGWRLTIDDELDQTLPVNWAFVGFRAPPGVHRIELDYSPAGWRWGLALFAFGLIASVATGLVGARGGSGRRTE